MRRHESVVTPDDVVVTLRLLITRRCLPVAVRRMFRLSVIAITLALTSAHAVELAPLPAAIRAPDDSARRDCLSRRRFTRRLALSHATGVAATILKILRPAVCCPRYYATPHAGHVFDSGYSSLAGAAASGYALVVRQERQSVMF